MMPNSDANVRLEVGRVLAGYRVKSKLGSNELSASYLAESTHPHDVGCQVVLKVPNPKLLAHRPTQIAFLREALAPTRLRHGISPEILSVEITDEGDLFLVRDYIAGETLAERLATAAAVQESLPPPVALAIAWHVACRLSEAHTRCVFHRALKPSNIVLLPRPEKPGGVTVRLLDFGITELRTPRIMASFECNAMRIVDLHRTEEVYDYAAPNGVVNESGLRPPTASEDVYSLGVILFQMLGGKPPNYLAYVKEQKTISRPADDLTRLEHALPIGTTVLLGRMMDSLEKQRPTMTEVQDALAGILDLPTSYRRARSKAVPALPKPKAT